MGGLRRLLAALERRAGELGQRCARDSRRRLEGRSGHEYRAFPGGEHFVRHEAPGLLREPRPEAAVAIPAQPGAAAAPGQPDAAAAAEARLQRLRHASKEEQKRTSKELMVQWHPDKNIDRSAEAKRVFQWLQNRRQELGIGQ